MSGWFELWMLVFMLGVIIVNLSQREQIRNLRDRLERLERR
jgi:hypothetical protein